MILYYNQIRFVFLLFILSCNPVIASSILDGVERLVPIIISTLPHDRQAFTQGLAIHDGYLYESTGLYGQSSLRKIDLKTGKVLSRIDVAPSFFAEGIAIIDRFIIQVTWKEKIAFVYNRENLRLEHKLSYQGEGWGLCSDGKHLLMSNGTSIITTYDPTSFQKLSTCRAKLGVREIELLNDLECVEDSIYINVWKQDIILRLNKYTGQITGIIDASQLLNLKEKKEVGTEGVLNGITYNPVSQTFWITGKYWPRLFEVRFISLSSLEK